MEKQILQRLKERLTATFRGNQVVLDDQAIKIPARVFNPIRRQWNSTMILQLLHEIKKENWEKRLVIGSTDLYTKNFNFVFGEADIINKNAVVSTQRLRPEFYGEASDSELFFNRLLKECVHELGHTFELVHCPDPMCVMHFSNSIDDTDVKQPDFCPHCKVDLKNK